MGTTFLFTVCVGRGLLHFAPSSRANGAEYESSRGKPTTFCRIRWFILAVKADGWLERRLGGWCICLGLRDSQPDARAKSVVRRRQRVTPCAKHLMCGVPLVVLLVERSLVLVCVLQGKASMNRWGGGVSQVKDPLMRDTSKPPTATTTPPNHHTTPPNHHTTTPPNHHTTKPPHHHTTTAQHTRPHHPTSTIHPFIFPITHHPTTTTHPSTHPLSQPPAHPPARPHISDNPPTM